MPPNAHIIGYGYTVPAIKSGVKVFDMIKNALEMSFKSLNRSNVTLSSLDGIITMPSIAEPKFMHAHYIATKMKIPPKAKFIAKTVDTCGASPVSAILEAKRLITDKGFDLIAVVSGDAVSSMPTEDFLNQVNVPFIDCAFTATTAVVGSKTPYIPTGYDEIAHWYVEKGSVTREQLAMACVLMSQQASHHPDALTKQPYTLQQVLKAPAVGKVTGLLECARRADGAAAILIASSNFILQHKIDPTRAPVILGGGEFSSALYPPTLLTDELFTCQAAVKQALQESKLTIKDIQYYSLYDCFPICLIKAVEAVGLAPQHRGGHWVQSMYERSISNGTYKLSPTESSINTHGGLMCFGAPFMTPAMYGIIESVVQLSGTAGVRQQVQQGVSNALVYGNGGVFSASAVAILSNTIKI